MKQIVKDHAWIILAAGLVFFTRLGATALWDLDEPLYAACAREMADRGDWVVPVFNGEYFYDKPPLMFWLMMSGTALFGQSEFAVRFWSPVIGILTALVTYHLGRMLFRREVGLWAGLIVASTVIFTVSARAATVDAALTLASTLAIGAFVLANRRLFRVGGGESVAEGAANEFGACNRRQQNCLLQSADGTRSVPATTWFLYALMWAMMGVAVLAKGPVGLLLPAAAVGLFLMIQHAPPIRGFVRGMASFVQRPVSQTRNLAVLLRGLADLIILSRVAWGIVQTITSLTAAFFRALWQMRPLTGLVVVVAVAVPWYVLVGLRTDGAWLQEFFAKYNLGPFVKPFMGHHGPFYYHFVAILIGFFPWSLFIGPMLYHVGRRIHRGEPWAAATTLLACWAGVWFVFWSVCSTKLPHYVLPAYPALALMTGCFLAEWLAEPARFLRAWSRNAAVTLVAVGVLLGIGAPLAAYWFVPGEELIGLVGLPLVIGGAVCWLFHYRGDLARFMPAFAATGVAFLVALFAFAAARVDRHQHSPALAEAMRGADDAPQVATYQFMQASLVYYVGQNVPRFDDTAELRAFLDRNPGGLVVTVDSRETELQNAIGDLEVVARRPRFLGRGEVVVLGRSCVDRMNSTASGNTRRQVY